MIADTSPTTIAIAVKVISEQSLVINPPSLLLYPFLLNFAKIHTIKFMSQLFLYAIDINNISNMFSII